MGLDMYLKTNSRDLARFVAEICVTNGIYEKDSFEYKMCRQNGVLKYWRKCNPIHGWMVENVQDGEDNCGAYELDRHDLRKLYLLIREALDTYDTSVLPCSSGFFFGDKEYTDYLWHCLEDTEVVLREILFSTYTQNGTDHFAEDPEWNCIFTYTSSW